MDEINPNRNTNQSVPIFQTNIQQSYEEEQNEIDEDDQNFCIANCSEVRKSLISSLAQVVSQKLWTNSNFLVYLLANGITGAGVVIPWTFVYDYALTVLSKMSTEGRIGKLDVTNISWLPSCIGIGLFAGQITVGLLMSQCGSLKDLRDSCKGKPVNSATKQLHNDKRTNSYTYRLCLFSTVLLINGMSTLAIALIPLDQITSTNPIFSLFNHAQGIGLGVACFIFGVTNGGLYVIFPQLLMDILGETLWPSGLGLFLAFNGMMNLAGTSLGGYINDISGSYLYAFICSACLPMTGLLLVVLYNSISCILRKFHIGMPESQLTSA